MLVAELRPFLCLFVGVWRFMKVAIKSLSTAVETALCRFVVQASSASVVANVCLIRRRRRRRHHHRHHHHRHCGDCFQVWRIGEGAFGGFGSFLRSRSRCLKRMKVREPEHVHNFCFDSRCYGEQRVVNLLYAFT